MAVIEHEQSQDDLNKEVAEVAKKKAAAIDAIIPSLGLPNGEDVDGKLNEIRTKEQAEIKKKRSERLSNEITRKEAEKRDLLDRKGDESDEDEESDESPVNKDEPKKKGASADKEDDEIEEDEELIPKSKVEKRFKQLTAEIKELKAMRDELKREAPKQDSDTEKLEKMSPDELKNVLRNVRALQIKIGSGEKEGNVEDYIDLEMKIHDAINSYPVRFHNEQVKALNRSIASLEYDEEISDPAKAVPEIRKIAEKVYRDHPHFSGTKDGMKAAWELAVEHYKIIQNTSADKEKTSQLKRENSKLKQKTALDSSRMKGQQGANAKLDLLRKKLASGGTAQDRSDFIKESPMFNINDLLPEEFR